MKFKLQATHNDGTVITHEFEEDLWYAALDGFVKFLRGNGYFVSDKSVGINLKAGITSIVKMSLTTTLHSLNKKRSLD